jgi:ABC-2 type transport system permease protein
MTEVRVVWALGRRSVIQTFRRPQLLAPILVFPTLLLAIQTGGAALGLVGALWFLAIGLVFGAEIAGGVPGALVGIRVAMAAAVAIGGIVSSVALRTGRASIVQGLFPMVFVVLFLSTAFFPESLMIEPARTIAAYNQMSFVVEGIREPIVSGLNGTDVLDAAIAILGIGLVSFALSARALRHRLRTGG